MTLNIIVDIVLVGIIITGMVIGIVKGFIKIIAKPLKPLLALAIALSLANALAVGFVEPVINEPIANQISGFLHDNCDMLNPENINESLPTLIKFAATLAGIDLEALVSDGESAIQVIVDTLVAPVVHIIAVAISFLIIYFISRILLSLVFALINAVFNAGAFRPLNKLLGLLTSFLLSVFVSWALVTAFEYVIHLPSFAENEMIMEFTGGAVYKIFKQYNPVELLLSF